MLCRALAAILERTSRAALYLYPAAFRAQFGADMAEVFVDVCTIRSRGRAGALLAHGGRALLGLVRAGVAERLGRSLQPDYHIPQGRRSRRPGVDPLNGLLQDLRFAVRSLLKRPAFSALVIGMLALGVAANAAIFSAFNSVLLRPFPFAEPDRLVDLDETAPAWNLEFVGISYPDFDAWSRLNGTFESMAVYDDQSFNLAVDGRPDRVRGALVSWRLLEVLGLEPQLGRDFTAADFAEDAPRVAMVSEPYWRTRMASDHGVLGSVLRVDSEEYTVIGVLPPEAVIPVGAMVWAPLSVLSFCCEPGQNSGSWWLDGVGRLADGVTIEQAREDLRSVHAGLVEELGDSRKAATPRVEPLHEIEVGDRRPILVVMLAAVGVLLLIACANVGGLMLARASNRAREMGIRVALGAARGRIVRQLLTESLLLSCIGGAIGVGLGHLAMQQLFRAMPEEMRGWVSLSTDWRFAAFAVALAGATALLFGLAPALHAARVQPQQALQATALRASAGRERRRALRFLVVAEIALAVVLLVGAGLLVQTFRSLTTRDPGFRSDVLTFAVSLPDPTYPDHAARLAFHERLRERVAELPGVESLGATTLRPLRGHTGYFFQPEDGVERPAEESSPVVLTIFATPEYFETMGITFLRGQPYGPREGIEEGAPFGVVVNETFARTFWGDVDVVGRRVHTGGDDMPWLTVAGVTRDTLHYGPDTPMRPGVFLPFASWFGDRRSAVVALRGRADVTSLLGPARQIAQEMDPDVAVFDAGTMGEHLRADTWSWRMYAGLLGVFAAAALALALGGIYSTVSYVVGQRRGEIGIRMALGARNRQVLGAVLRDGMVLTGGGLALGLVLAFVAAGLASTALVEASPRDPMLYLAVAGTLVIAALLANLLPARRAAGTDPMSALRDE